METKVNNTETSENFTVSDTITDIFARKRELWKDNISDTVKKMEKLSTITDGQTQAFSQRHMCVDEIHKILDTYNRLNAKYKIERNNIRKSSLNTDSKYAKEITEEIDAKSSTTKNTLDTLNSQIEFFRETIKSLDQILYGMKYRMDYELNFNRMS